MDNLGAQWDGSRQGKQEEGRGGGDRDGILPGAVWLPELRGHCFSPWSLAGEWWISVSPRPLLCLCPAACRLCGGEVEIAPWPTGVHTGSRSLPLLVLLRCSFSSPSLCGHLCLTLPLETLTHKIFLDCSSPPPFFLSIYLRDRELEKES